MIPDIKREIGRYEGENTDLLICAIGAMHGNESAGVLALRALFDMLEAEPHRNPHFTFKGRLVGILGNVQAYERRIRYVKKDLNRQFTPDCMSIFSEKNTPPQYPLFFEDLERWQLLKFLKKEIDNCQPQKIVILDLHTTSAEGGIFSIVAEDTQSLDIAKTLYAPVVQGFIKGIGGTTLHFFNTQNLGVPTVAISFEAGQHTDPLSVERTIAWLVNALRGIGAVAPHDVENRHEVLLKKYAEKLPKTVQLIGSHRIMPDDKFKMLPNFQNFQPIKKGEILATDRNGNICAPEDCMILMPLYQPQGEDGFFLVK